MRERLGQDRSTIIFNGVSPNRLACDTTLRLMPDGSWVVVMLGGGDREPLPENQVFLTRSLDAGKTWSPVKPLDLGFPRQGNTIAMVPSELMVHDGQCTLFVATHDGRFGGWKEWMVVSGDCCRTWGKAAAAPGRLHDRTFIRNHIVTRDGRILYYAESSDGPGKALNYPDGFVSADGRWLHFAFDDNRHRAVYVGAKLPVSDKPKSDNAKERRTQR